jgi:hypothetical protein
MRETPIGIGQHRRNAAPRPRVRTHPKVFQHALGCANPSRVPVARPNWRRLCGAPGRSLARHSRDPGQPKLCACQTCRQRPSGATTAGSDWTGSGTGRGVPQASRRRKYRPIRTTIAGGSQPPRHNAQALDEARNPVTVAGRRHCRASARVLPRWDQAFPCCSPLTGWALGPVAASRPSGPAAALSYLTEGGRVPLGSVDWQ